MSMVARARSGAAALEMALLAPIFVSLMVFTIDVGIALLSQVQIAQALATSAEYCDPGRAEQRRQRHHRDQCENLRRCRVEHVPWHADGDRGGQ